MTNYYIIDSHAHIFPEKIAEKAVSSIGEFYQIKMNSIGTSQALLESGSKINVQKYIVHSTATTENQVASINAFIHNECQKHSEFIGFGALHPNSDNLESELQQIKDYGLLGVKLHPEFQHFDIDSTKSIEMLRTISKFNLPVLIHLGDPRHDFSRPYRLANALDQIPDLRVIGAHLGGYERWDEALDTLVGRDLLLDTSSSLAFLSPEKVRQIISKHGDDKIVFGVDFPMWNHDREYDLFLNLGLSEKTNRKILSENIIKFLNLNI